MKAPALSCAVWLITGVALAQPVSPPSPAAHPAPTAVGEVVVQGHAPATPQSFAKTVEEFVHDQGKPGPVDQVSRWGQPLCPMTAGLSPGFNDFVTQRIKQVASRVGAVGPGVCGKGVDVLVVFTTQPDEVMADVREHHSELLGYHYVSETKSLAAFQPPMKSWYVTMTIAGDFVSVDGAYHRLWPDGYTHFPPPVRSEFAFALVVVDARLLEGQTIGPVADRVAMLVLSRPAPRDGCSPLPSVLDVLDPNCPSGASTKGLTSYDEAYLKALYAYKGSELRYFERRSIAKQIIGDTGPTPPAAPGLQSPTPTPAVR